MEGTSAPNVETAIHQPQTPGEPQWLFAPFLTLARQSVKGQRQEEWKARPHASRRQRQHHLELSSSIVLPKTYPNNTNMAPQEEQPYRPKDALGASIKAGMITTGAGLFVSTIQNTLTKQNYGAMGAFTKFGGTTAVYGMLCPQFSALG